MKNFVLIGAAGYIAPRHLKAIKDTDNNLIAALDKHDSVGILDSYFPDAAFFTEFERFDRHVDKLIRNGVKIDYVSICSPNYLHDAHIRFGLRIGAEVICEKPIVLNPWNIEGLKLLELETKKKVYPILQLRHHSALIQLKKQISSSLPDKIFDVELTYITSRGKWYYASWKGDLSKSGGIATNIGIHFYDMLIWLFGDVQESLVHIHTHDRAAGIIKLNRAVVKWYLTINSEALPQVAKSQGAKTYRSIKVEGQEIEFSNGFADLHTVSYHKILNGEGFDLDDAVKAIKLVHDIRNTIPIGAQINSHELVRLPLSPHPFG